MYICDADIHRVMDEEVSVTDHSIVSSVVSEESTPNNYLTLFDFSESAG